MVYFRNLVQAALRQTDRIMCETEVLRVTSYLVAGLLLRRFWVRSEGSWRTVNHGPEGDPAGGPSGNSRSRCGECCPEGRGGPQTLNPDPTDVSDSQGQANSVSFLAASIRVGQHHKPGSLTVYDGPEINRVQWKF